MAVIIGRIPSDVDLEEREEIGAEVGAGKAATEAVTGKSNIDTGSAKSLSELIATPTTTTPPPKVVEAVESEANKPPVEVETPKTTTTEPVHMGDINVDKEASHLVFPSTTEKEIGLDPLVDEDGKDREDYEELSSRTPDSGQPAIAMVSGNGVVDGKYMRVPQRNADGTVSTWGTNNDKINYTTKTFKAARLSGDLDNGLVMPDGKLYDVQRVKKYNALKVVPESARDSGIDPQTIFRVSHSEAANREEYSDKNREDLTEMRDIANKANKTDADLKRLKELYDRIAKSTKEDLVQENALETDEAKKQRTAQVIHDMSLASYYSNIGHGRFYNADSFVRHYNSVSNNAPKPAEEVAAEENNDATPLTNSDIKTSSTVNILKDATLGTPKSEVKKTTNGDTYVISQDNSGNLSSITYTDRQGNEQTIDGLDDTVTIKGQVYTDAEMRKYHEAYGANVPNSVNVGGIGESEFIIQLPKGGRGSNAAVLVSKIKVRRIEEFMRLKPEEPVTENLSVLSQVARLVSNTNNEATDEFTNIISAAKNATLRGVDVPDDLLIKARSIEKSRRDLKQSLLSEFNKHTLDEAEIKSYTEKIKELTGALKGVEAEMDANTIETLTARGTTPTGVKAVDKLDDLVREGMLGNITNRLYDATSTLHQVLISFFTDPRATVEDFKNAYSSEEGKRARQNAFNSLKDANFVNFGSKLVALIDAHVGTFYRNAATRTMLDTLISQGKGIKLDVEDRRMLADAGVYDAIDSIATSHFHKLISAEAQTNLGLSDRSTKEKMLVQLLSNNEYLKGLGVDAAVLDNLDRAYTKQSDQIFTSIDTTLTQMRNRIDMLPKGSPEKAALTAQYILAKFFGHTMLMFGKAIKNFGMKGVNQLLPKPMDLDAIAEQLLSGEFSVTSRGTSGVSTNISPLQSPAVRNQLIKGWGLLGAAFAMGATGMIVQNYGGDKNNPAPYGTYLNIGGFYVPVRMFDPGVETLLNIGGSFGSLFGAPFAGRPSGNALDALTSVVDIAPNITDVPEIFDSISRNGLNLNTALTTTIGDTISKTAGSVRYAGNVLYPVFAAAKGQSNWMQDRATSSSPILGAAESIFSPIKIFANETLRDNYNEKDNTFQEVNKKSMLPWQTSRLTATDYPTVLEQDPTKVTAYLEHLSNDTNTTHEFYDAKKMYDDALIKAEGDDANKFLEAKDRKNAEAAAIHLDKMKEAAKSEEHKFEALKIFADNSGISIDRLIYSHDSNDKTNAVWSTFLKGMVKDAETEEGRSKLASYSRVAGVLHKSGLDNFVQSSFPTFIKTLDSNNLYRENLDVDVTIAQQMLTAQGIPADGPHLLAFFTEYAKISNAEFNRTPGEAGAVQANDILGVDANTMKNMLYQLDFYCTQNQTRDTNKYVPKTTKGSSGGSKGGSSKAGAAPGHYEHAYVLENPFNIKNNTIELNNPWEIHPEEYVESSKGYLR